MGSYTDPNSLIARVGGQWAGHDLQREFQREVAELLKRNQLSFPGAQPVSFAGKHLEELKNQDYYVCEKTDGVRYLMYLTNDGDKDIHYLIDRKNDYYYVPGLHFPHHEDKTFQKFHTGTILDGELVEDKFPDRPPVIKFLVFDCLVIDHNILLQRPLDKRLGYFKLHILNPYKAWLRTNPSMVQPFLVEDKTTEFSYGLEKMFKEIIPKVKQLHGNDGLIFTCKNTPYKPGTDENILKWKPPHDNTIDFLLHITWPKVEPDPEDPDQSLQDDYLAFPEEFSLFINHGNDQYENYGDVLVVNEEEWEQMKQLGRPLQNSIVECYLADETPLNADHVGDATNPYDSDNHPNGGGGSSSSYNNSINGDEQQKTVKKWKLYRFRDDKNDANHVSTYFSVIDSIRDRVTEDDLLNNADSIRTAWKRRDELMKRRGTVPNIAAQLGPGAQNTNGM